MRLALVICISLITAYQPAIAGVDAKIDDAVTPAQPDVSPNQSTATAPDSAALSLSDGSRGQMLYENHCTSCHESMVYIRAKRKASSYKDLGKWVSQRADWLNLHWGDLEKQDVLQYLNERYYQFPLPE